MSNGSREDLKKTYDQELAELGRLKREVERKEASIRLFEAYLKAEGILEEATWRKGSKPKIPPEHPLSELQPPEAQITG